MFAQKRVYDYSQQLYSIAKKRERPRHLSMDERTHQMWSAHTTGYDVVVKRNEAVAHANHR